MTRRHYYAITAFVPLLAVLTHCGLGKDSGARGVVVATTCTATGTPSGGAAQAYQTTVYPYVVQNCAACHSGQGPVGFAVSDINPAYAAALTVVNFSNISSSPLAVYAGNSHCNTSVCTGASGTMQNLIAQWKSAQGSASGSTLRATACATPTPTNAPTVAPAGQLATGWMSIPSPLPTPPASVEMRFPLDSLGSNFAGVIFSVQVSQNTATSGSTLGSYLITTPVLASPAQSFLINGIRLVIQTPGGGDADLQ